MAFVLVRLRIFLIGYRSSGWDTCPSISLKAREAAKSFIYIFVTLDPATHDLNSCNHSFLQYNSVSGIHYAKLIKKEYTYETSDEIDCYKLIRFLAHNVEMIGHI